MPVLIVSEKTSPQDGFSRKRVIVRAVVGDDDAELERIGHALQRDRRVAPLARDGPRAARRGRCRSARRRRS